MGCHRYFSWFRLALLLGWTCRSSAVISVSSSKSNAFILPNSYVRKQKSSSSLRLNKASSERDKGKSSDEVEQIILEKSEREWRRPDLFGESLVEQTLETMKSDTEYQAVKKKYETQGAVAVSKEERALRRRALDVLGIPNFNQFLKQTMKTSVLHRRAPTILQINVGLYCNQACGHCHVESSPLRTEMMTTDIAARCLHLLVNTPSIQTLDITGGAPELNDNFRYLVTTARQLKPDLEIIDRCNLTVLQEPGQEDLVEFLKRHRVRIIASLPCYSAANVDQQRGKGVFERSIAALLALNDAGYGIDPLLSLDLVYNPSGAFLPPAQSALQDQYKAQLKDNFGILFNKLFTLTNMPVKRFADFLHRRGELKDYMQLLAQNFNADTLDSLMCVDTVSVGFDGRLYDCDFNQQLGLGIVTKPLANKDVAQADALRPRAVEGVTVFEIENLGPALADIAIRTDNHCFGCTAGMGSSCQGTTAS